MRDNTQQNHVAGHDAPVLTRAQDDYDRWPIATAISSVIASSPHEWSTRIGLYGKWGDGKTTVLNFLATQQQAAGNVVIRYSPWGVSNEAQVWSDFGKQLRKELSANGIKLGRLWRLWFTAKEWKSQLVALLKGVINFAQPALPFPIPKGVVDATAGLIERNFLISKKDVARISRDLGSRRVVVFIDDLDRTDPIVIPKLLLALRELLDFSKFVFVLAFDRTVVSKSLRQYNAAWGDSGEVFIEKVIDFPFELSAPSPKQVMELARRQFSLICPFVPITAVEDILAVMPRSPRRLKLFARLIASLTNEVKRHEPDELDWSTILIFGLLRIESEDFTNEFINRICDDNEFNWMAWAFNRDPTEEQDAKLEELLGLFPSMSETTRKRLRVLVKAWQQKRSFSQGEILKYQVYFALRPHNITWGEFKDFFREWQLDKAPQRVPAFVKIRASVMDAPEAVVAEEFIESVIGHYGSLLERASNVTSQEEHQALINDASDCLDLYKEVFLGGNENHCDATQMVGVWERMVSVCSNWQHFTGNVGEPALREKESKILELCAKSLKNAPGAFEALKPWDDRPVFNDRSEKLKKKFFQKLRDALEPKVIDEAIALFKLNGGIRPLISGENHRGFAYLLSAPESTIFQEPNRLRLSQAISAGTEDAVIRQNVLEYLDLLLGSLEHAGRFCTATERRKFITDFPDLVGKIWEVVVCRPSQYRFLSGLREKRKQLIEAGANGDTLIQPDWLLQTHTDPIER